LPSISIVVPAYNEEKRLPASLEVIDAYLRRSSWSSYELLVVDDGSKDGTAAVAERFAATHPYCRLLRNPGNQGKGYSVRHGMLEASKEWALFSDADLSAPIEELDKLYAAAAAAGVEVAIGSRALNRALIGVHQSPLREWAGRIFNMLMQILTGLRYWDTQCGFKLFRADAAREIFRRQQINGFGFDAEALFVARLLGYRGVETAVRWNHAEGTKVSMFGDSVNMFLDLLRIWRYRLAGRYR